MDMDKLFEALRNLPDTILSFVGWLFKWTGDIPEKPFDSAELVVDFQTYPFSFADVPWGRMHFQIVALLIFLLVFINYLRTNKLPVLSTYAFSLMMFFSGVNLIADVVTVYTLTNINTVPSWFNRMAHQLFIASLDSIVYCLMLYIFFLAWRQKRIQLLWLIPLSLPYIASLAMVARGTLDYFNDGSYIYSFGIMADSVYITTLIYLVIINILTFKEKANFDGKTREAVRAGTLIWVIVGVVQGLDHRVLITSLGVSLMLLYVYLSFVKPGELLDRETGAFTRYAFNVILSNRLPLKHKFYVVGLAFEDMGKLNRQLGNESSAKLLKEVTDFFHDSLNADIYHYRGSALAAIAYGSETKVYADVERMLDRFCHHWTVDSVKVYVRCHADIIHCPEFAPTTDDVYALLDYMFDQQSDDKEKHLQIADSALIARQKRQTTISLLLDEAIKEDGFDVVLQPIYDPTSDSFTSAEALVRLKDKETVGFVGPDEFIPIAEHLGIVSDIDMIVLRKVCEFSAENKLWEKGVHYIEVNLSGLQVKEHDLTASLFGVMDSYGIPNGFINFEVTESVAVEAKIELQTILRDLKEYGCSTSMDDFGTGYSNISQLGIVTYDLIKLDKSLIWPCFDENGEDPQVILDSLINMVLQLKRQIVAEGVETQEQADYLIKNGVQHLQGYLYSRPLPMDDYLSFIESKAQAA